MNDRSMSQDRTPAPESAASDDVSLGFAPAFLDENTGKVYVSHYPDGRPAPVHVPDGLPDELVATRSATGRVRAIRDGVVAGFVRLGHFYTREQAAALWNIEPRVLRRDLVP